MKNKIIISIVVAICLLILVIVGGKVFLGERITCDICEKQYYEKTGKTTVWFGELTHFCRDCYSGLELVIH